MIILSFKGKGEITAETADEDSPFQYGRQNRFQFYPIGLKALHAH